MRLEDMAMAIMAKAENHCALGGEVALPTTGGESGVVVCLVSNSGLNEARSTEALDEETCNSSGSQQSLRLPRGLLSPQSDLSPCFLATSFLVYCRSPSL